MKMRPEVLQLLDELLEVVQRHTDADKLLPEADRLRPAEVLGAIVGLQHIVASSMGMTLADNVTVLQRLSDQVTAKLLSGEKE